MHNILIVSHNCFSKTKNNGKTLSSLFSCFPKLSLHQIYFISDKDIDTDLCEDYYYINELNQRGVVHSHTLNIGDGNLSNMQICLSRFKSKFKYMKNGKLLYFVRDKIWQRNKWQSIQLKEWISKNQIELIFFVAGDSCFSHYLCQDLANEFNLPLVVFFTDDYILGYKAKGFLDKLYFKRLQNAYLTTIFASSYCYAIGEKMAAEYQAYWNKSFDYMMNSINILPPTPLPLNNTLVFSYFGGLHLGRWQSLILLSNLFNKINLSKRFELHVYTSTNLTKNEKNRMKKAGIILHKSIQDSELVNKMLSSDFLVHIESFEPKFQEITKLSVSTKIPEYLIANRPIVGFGPEGLASIQLLEENDIGFIVKTTEKDTVKLKELLENVDLQISLANKGYEYASSNFSKDTNSLNLKENLINIIQNRTSNE